MNQRRNDTDRGRPNNSEKNLSQCHFVHTNTHTPHGLTWARTLAFAVRSRWLTAWATARPSVSIQELLLNLFYLLNNLLFDDAFNISHNIAKDDRMNSEWLTGKYAKEAIVDYINIFMPTFAWKPRKSSLRIAGLRDDIWTLHLEYEAGAVTIRPQCLWSWTCTLLKMLVISSSQP
jgi:hypothetical protein